MIAMAQTMRRRPAAAIALAAMSVLMAGRFCVGQTASGQATPRASAVPVSSEPGVMLDRLVAVVNGEVILESDVDEERRFEEVQPYRTIEESTRAKIIERLVDRTLILQQAALEPQDTVTDKELDTQLATLRKDVPGCKPNACETDAGWKDFLASHGFTVEEFSSRWQKRMQLLKFIEVRFRNGISVKDDEVQAYYEKTMLPEYEKRHVTPPPVDAIKRRIEEVLLQQQVSALLQDWLKSLRAQGSVWILTPGEVAP
jgi:peptidyl-prolyl cis-trans isomerase SurA